MSARPAMGTSKRRRLKRELLARDGTFCFYCARPLLDDITFEHLVPRRHGGPDTTANLVLTHRDCNLQMGGRPAAEKIRLHVARRAPISAEDREIAIAMPKPRLSCRDMVEGDLWRPVVARYVEAPSGDWFSKVMAIIAFIFYAGRRA